MWSPSKAAALSAAKRRSSVRPTINLWPFLAILVVLLIVFMVSPTPLHFHLWVPVDLPRSVYAAPQPGALRDDAIRISIRRDGSVYFRNMQVMPEDLSGLIRDSLKNGSEKKVYIAVDSRTKFLDAEKVVDQIRLAGVQQICFLAERPR
jgi:biopolymer transport protein ExbD